MVMKAKLKRYLNKTKVWTLTSKWLSDKGTLGVITIA